MTITVEELRRKYPSPVSFQVPQPYDTYCVGKALCLELGMPHGAWDIPYALQMVNPRLTGDDAIAFYVHIVQENDAGNFDIAWAWLDKALTA